MIFLAALLSTSLLLSSQSAPASSQPEEAQVASPRADAITTTIGDIIEAMKSDDSVARVYFLRKPTEDGSLIFLLVPIFDKKYPQVAIDSAYRAFWQNMPAEAKVELFLVPKRDYKKYFGQIEPIYVRP